MKKIIIGNVVLLATIAVVIAGLELTSSYKDSIAINTKAPVQNKKQNIQEKT